MQDDHEVYIRASQPLLDACAKLQADIARMQTHLLRLKEPEQIDDDPLFALFCETMRRD